jgi:hypothetical protein
MTDADREQLDIVTQLISEAVEAFNQTPTFQGVAPYMSVLQIWLQNELKRRQREITR